MTRRHDIEMEVEAFRDYWLRTNSSWTMEEAFEKYTKKPRINIKELIKGHENTLESLSRK